MKKNFLTFLDLSSLSAQSTGNEVMAKRTMFLVKNSAPKLQCQMIV